MTNPGRETAALVRFLRGVGDLSQRGMAAQAGLSPTTIQTLESGEVASSAVQRITAAAGYQLWAWPSPPPDPTLDRNLAVWFDQEHPLDRVHAIVLDDGRDVAGLPCLEWLAELDVVARHQGLLLGAAAGLFWSSGQRSRPPITDARVLVVPPCHLPELRGRWQIDELSSSNRSSEDLVALGLPGHLWRTSSPASPGLLGALCVLHPADLMLLSGWDPDLARATWVLDRVPERDRQGRREPASRPNAPMQWRSTMSQWPSRGGSLRGHPLPRRAIRRPRWPSPSSVRAELERSRAAATGSQQQPDREER